MWYLGDERVSEPHDGAPHVVLCPCTPPSNPNPAMRLHLEMDLQGW